MELLDWLRKQLDDDEAAARKASQGPWAVGNTQDADWGPRQPPDNMNIGARILDEHGEWPKPVVREGSHVCAKGDRPHQIAYLAGWSPDHERLANAEHIARHDPARVLAEVDAKRRIIEVAIGEMDHGDFGWAWSQVLALLALPYADRPGYQDEWRP